MKTEKKKGRKRDVWESQCEESKQVRINDIETSFFFFTLSELTLLWQT